MTDTFGLHVENDDPAQGSGAAIAAVVAKLEAVPGRAALRYARTALRELGLPYVEIERLLQPIVTLRNLDGARGNR